MSEIVGLDDSKLLRSDYVYDATQGKKQSEINTELVQGIQGIQKLSVVNKFNAKDYFSAVTSGTITWQRFGPLVLLTFQEVVSATGYYSIALSAMNIPKPIYTVTTMATCNGYAAGQIGSSPEYLFFVARPSTDISNMGGVLAYFTND